MNAPQIRVASKCSRLCQRRRLLLPTVSPLSAYNSKARSFFSQAGSPQLLLSEVKAKHPRCNPSIDVHRYGFINRQLHATPFNANLLGHSPMAPAVPTTSQQTARAKSPGAQGPSWGVDANTKGGGVWANTSAKKEKLAELLTEMNSDGIDTATKGMETLDDAATSQEKLDLELADGLKMVAKFVDYGMKNDNATDSSEDTNIVVSLRETAVAANNATEQMFQLLESASTVEEWEKPKYEATLNEVIRVLSVGLPEDPNLKKPEAGSLDVNNPFCYLREFIADTESNSVSDTAKVGQIGEPSDEVEIEQQAQLLNNITNEAFSSSTQLYRTLLLRATAQTLLDHWDTITTVTSGDIDRGAVSKTVVPRERSTVKAQSIRKIFEAYANGANEEWVQSWWNCIDDDGDGLIDEEEMNNCVDLAIKPVHMALSDMVNISLEACPARAAGMGGDEPSAWFLGGEDISNINTSSSTNSSAASKMSKKLSWRNRRKELKARKALTKAFQATVARHFSDQVETPHRLRCIYAWAEKSHQDNKLDSILVDASEEWGAASSIVGRQRYVELVPKISYAEFREEQAHHFPHLDKIGEEVAFSFKEDIWVLQGNGRQNKELKRDCALFLLGVSLIDFAIIML